MTETVYSMNNAAEQIMRMEDNSTILGRVILENFCKNLKELEQARQNIRYVLPVI